MVGLCLGYKPSCRIVSNQVSSADPRSKPFIRERRILMMNVADGECMIRLSSYSKSEITSWYRIWEAATFAMGMCTAKGLKGEFRKLGKSCGFRLSTAIRLILSQV